MATLIFVEEVWPTSCCFAECVGLYPVLLSDKKEGTLQTAVTETQPQEKAKRSSTCLYFIHHLDLLRYGYKPRGGFHIKRTGVRCTFQGLKKRFWYVLGCSALKVSQREPSRYLLGYWAENNVTGDSWQSTLRMEGIRSNRLYRYWKLWLLVPVNVLF